MINDRVCVGGRGAEWEVMEVESVKNKPWGRDQGSFLRGWDQDQLAPPSAIAES